MPTKKRRQRKLFQPAYYNVQITDWDWTYSFSANVSKYDERQFADYRHLLVRGMLLRPRKIEVELSPGKTSRRNERKKKTLPGALRQGFRPTEGQAVAGLRPPKAAQPARPWREKLSTLKAMAGLAATLSSVSMRKALSLQTPADSLP
jgi:hypothetical protein